MWLKVCVICAFYNRILSAFHLTKAVFPVSVIVLSIRPYLTYSGLVTDLPPNENIRGLYVDAHNEQEGQEVIATLNRIANTRVADIEEEANENEEAEVEAEVEAEDEDEDDQATSTSPKSSPMRKLNSFLDISVRPPRSRSPSCTINVYFNQSVVSFDSEVTGTTLNAGTGRGVNEGLHVRCHPAMCNDDDMIGVDRLALLAPALRMIEN
jgi:hypothetical protein